MVARLWGGVGTGKKEGESSTGRDWAAAFYHVTAPSCLLHILNLRTVYFFRFPNFFLVPGQPQITETADTDSVDTVVHLYYVVSEYINNNSPVRNILLLSTTFKSFS
jgi:hypothetical protein